jgi:hypothetical protein
MLKLSFKFHLKDLGYFQAIVDVESISDVANSAGTAKKVVMLFTMPSKNLSMDSCRCYQLNSIN